MPEAARHFVIATWLAAMAPSNLDIHTAALQNYSQRSLPPLDTEQE